MREEHPSIDDREMFVHIVEAAAPSTGPSSAREGTMGDRPQTLRGTGIGIPESFEGDMCKVTSGAVKSLQRAQYPRERLRSSGGARDWGSTR